MTPPTFTDAELLALSGTLDRLLDELRRSADLGAHTARGYLLDADDAAIVAAKTVADRLHRFRKWPSLYTEDSYLPAPTLRCPTCGATEGRHHAECPHVPAPQSLKSDGVNLSPWLQS